MVILNFKKKLRRWKEWRLGIWVWKQTSFTNIPGHFGGAGRDKECPTLNHRHGRVPSILYQINKETRSWGLTDLVGGCTIEGIDGRWICKPPVEGETNITKWSSLSRQEGSKNKHNVTGFISKWPETNGDMGHEGKWSFHFRATALLNKQSHPKLNMVQWECINTPGFSLVLT